VSHLSFGATLLAAVLRHHVATKARPIPGLEALSLKDVDPECSIYLSPKLNELEGMKNSKTLQQTIDALLSELRSKKGMGYPTGLSKYFPIWEMLRRDYDQMVDHYRGLDPEIYEHEGLQAHFTSVEQTSANIG
jgi:hypothetical protein